MPETYVHRIGRTARAGAGGAAISFCDAEERAFLRDIEREIRMQIPVVEDHPWHRAIPAARPPSRVCRSTGGPRLQRVPLPRKPPAPLRRI